MKVFVASRHYDYEGADVVGVGRTVSHAKLRAEAHARTEGRIESDDVLPWRPESRGDLVASAEVGTVTYLIQAMEVAGE
jgi:hypothetical protein